MKDVVALGLFSGGLDSILACKVVAKQGIRVIALKCITPFFDYELLARAEAYKQEVAEKYGLEVHLLDLSDTYLQLLHKPRHGYGKHFNPCIDCKILMLSRARAEMERYGASFLITGEVLGQRPMSQRRDTLNVIERDSGCEDLLLRPLSAKRMSPIAAERQGLVDREQLYGFSGRGRKPQIALAKELGITEYPNPAGGCILTDANLGKRIERLYKGDFTGQDEQSEDHKERHVKEEKTDMPSPFTANDINLLLVGRQFFLPPSVTKGPSCRFVLGRNKSENEQLEGLAQPGDLLLTMPSYPGPLGLLRCGAAGEEQSMIPAQHVLQTLAGLVVRYGKKRKDGPRAEEVQVLQNDTPVQTLQALPLDDALWTPWKVE